MENPDIDRPAVHIGFPFFAALFAASFFGAPFAAVSAVLLHGRRTAVKLAESMQLNRRNAVLAGILLIWCLCSMSGVSTYLYFKF